MNDQTTTENDIRSDGPGKTRPPSPSENFLVVEQLQRMPAVFARGLLYLVVGLVVAAVAFSLVGRMDVVVTCRAVARPDIVESDVLAPGKSHPLPVARTGEIAAYRSKVLELRERLPLKTRLYRAKIKVIDDKLKQSDVDYQQAVKIQALKLQQNTLRLTTIIANAKYWKAEVKNLEKEFENTTTLFEKKLTSIGEFNAIKSRLERAKTEVSKGESDAHIALKEAQILEQEIRTEEALHKSSKTVLLKEIEQLKAEEQATLQGMRRELALNEKMLAMQDGFVRLAPDGTPLYMDITVANRDIGFIEKGMKIKYKIDAFPHSDYGTLEGIVEAVSPSAAEQGVAGFVYSVRGSLNVPCFEIKGRSHPVKAGMTATAEMVTETKSIFSILFRKIKE